MYILHRLNYLSRNALKDAYNQVKSTDVFAYSFQVVPDTIPVPVSNVKLVSQYTPTPGSINLTITNGAVNLRPASHPPGMKPDMANPRPTLLRANISGSGSLQRLPIQNLGNQAINLKLNPIMRFTGTTIAGGKVAANQVHTAPQGILRPLTLRPLTSGSVQPLVPGPPITLRSVSSCGNPSIAPMPIVQAVPQNIAAQLISQGSTTLIQTGAKIASTIGQIQYMPGQQGGKLQMRTITSQPIKIRPAIAGDQHVLAPLTMTPINVNNDAVSNQPVNLAQTSKDIGIKSPLSSVPKIENLSKEGKQKSSSSTGSSKEGKVKTKRKDSVKTKLASIEAPLIKDDGEEGTSGDHQQSVKPSDNPKGKSESTEESIGDSLSEKEAICSNSGPDSKEKNHKSPVKEENADSKEEEVDGLVWKDGIGTLQGSDIRYLCRFLLLTPKLMTIVETSDQVKWPAFFPSLLN